MNETNKNEQTNDKQMQAYNFNENMRSKGIIAISIAVVLSVLVICIGGTFLLPLVFCCCSVWHFPIFKRQHKSIPCKMPELQI